MFFFVIFPFLWQMRSEWRDGSVKWFAPLNFWRPCLGGWMGAVAPLISLRPLAVVSPHLAGRQVHCALVPLWCGHAMMTKHTHDGAGMCVVSTALADTWPKGNWEAGFMEEFGTYITAAKLFHWLIRGQAVGSIGYATWKDFLVKCSLQHDISG